MSIQIVNKKTHKPTPNDFYIGRGSILGNPFSSNPKSKAHFLCPSKDEAIEKFGKYLFEQINNGNVAVIGEAHHENNDVNLVCYCTPQKCHGEVIKALIKFIDNATSS